MKQKLLFKLTLIVVLFSLALYAFVAINTAYRLKAGIMPIFVERTKSTAYSLEANIRNEEELKDKERLLALVQKSMWLDPDIVGININIKDNGSLVTYLSNNPINNNQLSDPSNLNSFNNDVFVSQTITNGTNEILRAISPIHISGQLVGTVQIDFDLSTINNTISTISQGAIITYAIIFGIIVIVLFLVVRILVIRPIIDIKKGIDSVKKLNFDYTIKVKTKDEIGALADAFNLMAVDLKKSKIETENYNQKLKQEVEEQTRSLEVAKNKLENVNLDLEKKVQIRTAELEKLKSNQEELIKQRTAELDQKINEMEKLNRFMVNRENKMIELKKEIQELKKQQ